MNINLQSDELIIKEGAANHFKGFEAVGGRLFLTNQRLFFSSHVFNIQAHQLIVPFTEISSVGKRNTLFIVPNGLYVECKNGVKEKFVLWNRSLWIKLINEQIALNIVK